MKYPLYQLMIQRGLVLNQQEALSQVLAGNVISDNKKFSSIHELLPEGERIRLKKKPGKYVSRGGDKLASIFELFNINIQEVVCLDCGASTGGFTDFLLQNGAQSVIAVDVGYGILDDKLQRDPRVINIDRCNLKTVEFEEINNLLKNHPKNLTKLSLPVELCVGDLSFISLRKILPNIKSFVKAQGDFLLLYKPQFEANKFEVPEGGVIEDEALLDRLLQDFIKDLPQYGYQYLSHQISGLSGVKGNTEFFIHLKST